MKGLLSGAAPGEEGGNVWPVFIKGASVRTVADGPRGPSYSTNKGRPSERGEPSM